MAVPCHDERDFAFAKKYNLPLKVVINPIDKETKKEIILEADKMTEAFTEMGIMTNSGEFNGIPSKKALTDIAVFVEENGNGQRTVKYS